jgi:hypothetical protein
MPTKERSDFAAQIRKKHAYMTWNPASPDKIDPERSLTIRRVLDLLTLPENESGNVCAGSDPKAAERLLRWLLTLYDETVSAATPRFIAPVISATPQGDAVAKWRNGEKSLSISVSPLCRAEYIKAWGKDISSERAVDDANAPGIRYTLYRWMTE